MNKDREQHTCELLGAHDSSGVLLGLGLLRAGHLRESVESYRLQEISRFQSRTASELDPTF